MNFKTLFLRLAQNIDIYHSKELMVRIATRDENGVVTSCKDVTISYILLGGLEPRIGIEQSDIDKTYSFKP